MKDRSPQARCDWCGDDPLYVQYHDEEWGVPIHDDVRLLEMLILEGAQAGLSWITVLRKRERYREVLYGFDACKIVRHMPRRIDTLMQDPGIIRNRNKLEATVGNARAFLDVQEEFGSFDAYIWRFVEGAPIVNQRRSLSEIPAETPESGAMSKDLKKRGFAFVGPTICYAYMQACGLVNDHIVSCFRHEQLQ